jgi:hypothetical protein
MKRGGEQVVEVPPDFDVWELVENKKSNQQEGNRGVNCFVAHGARVCFLKAYYNRRQVLHTDDAHRLATARRRRVQLWRACPVPPPTQFE